jgi:hypothetical protein
MSLVDLDKAATTLRSFTNTVLSDSGLASNISAGVSSLTPLKNSVISGSGSTVSNVTGAVAGVSNNESILQNSANNLNKVGDSFQNSLNSVFKNQLGITGRVPNPLHYYSSYNCIFTLSVLDDLSLNFPNETYRKGMLGPLILKSGSGDPRNRIPTANKTAQNPSGSFDFYIDDVEIVSVIAMNQSTGNANHSGIKFNITEPYSMGIFFQTLQAAALRAGHKNYLEAPILLTVEFKGHVSSELQNQTIDKTTKYFPLRLSTFNMRVNGSGSVYDVVAYPYHERSFSTTYSQLKTDVSIKGKTVAEMLQTGEKSLQWVLNDVLNERKKTTGAAIADQILISFPKDLATGGTVNSASSDTSKATSATMDPYEVDNAGSQSDSFFAKLGLTTSSVNNTQVQEQGNINDLGNSTMGFNLYNKGDTPFAKDNLAYDEKTGTYKRGNITINPAEGEFKFAQGSDIANAINQVILMSDYGRTALTQVNESTGVIKWWRIETHLYFIPSDDNLAITGQKPKLIVYRVVPHDVDVSLFLPPNATRPGVEETKKQVIKEYNYIYTGKNIDVLDFEIEFNAGFYTAINADAGKNNEGKSVKKNTGGADDGVKENKNDTPSGSAPSDKNVLPTSQYADSVKTTTANRGGGGNDDTASIAARQFHDAITFGTDMVNLDLSILGDPYYLGDSGMGNYTALATDNRYMTADKSIDYQRGPIHVLLNFRTPIDINHSTGLYDFSNTANVPQFSGLYQLNTVTSRFSNGKFLQSLKMFRLRGQDSKSTTATKLSMTPETASSEAITNEDGSISNIRRNLETGDLYDATGLYDNQGKPIR